MFLKKGISCCCCCKPKSTDEEESLYTDPEHDEEDELLNEEVNENGEVPYDEENPPMEEEPPPPDIPEIVVTEGSFKTEKKKKGISHMFKKIKKGKGRVRFNTSSDKVSMISSEGSIEPTNYGSMSLTPLKRSDSMESFMSSVSTATANIEEFGEELSPSRLQIFVQYDPKLWVITVGAKQAECLVSTSKDNMYWQAHMTLLPFKKHKFKTKYKSTSTPVFNQNFEIENIAQQALTQLSVRYRIYGRPGRAGRKKLAGETEVELSAIMSMEDKIIKDWRILRRKGSPPVKQESDV